MGKIRQINIKNRNYYFYNDQIDLKDFDARLLKIDKKDYCSDCNWTQTQNHLVLKRAVWPNG